MHRLQDVGGGDVGHVERRVLAHQDDVEGRELDHLFIAQREMIALLAAQAHRPRARDRLAVAQGQLARMVVPQLVPARLGAEPHDERGIPLDIDALDRVHLDGNAQGHGSVFQARLSEAYVGAPGRRRQAARGLWCRCFPCSSQMSSRPSVARAGTHAILPQRCWSPWVPGRAAARLARDDRKRNAHRRRYSTIPAKRFAAPQARVHPSPP